MSKAEIRCCDHAPRKGIVTTHPDGYDGTGPHAACNCCGRDGCITLCIAWTVQKTGIAGVYREDKR